jgi:hypothetical protein
MPHVYLLIRARVAVFELANIIINDNLRTTQRAGHRWVVGVCPKAADSLSLFESGNFESVLAQRLQR